MEAEAKLCLQNHIREGDLELAWSYILDLENSANPFEERKRAIAGWQALSHLDVSENPDIFTLAGRLRECGFKSKDALHIACAVVAQCDYFITTDDEILKRQDLVPEITICDPTRVVRELGL